MVSDGSQPPLTFELHREPNSVSPSLHPLRQRAHNLQESPAKSVPARRDARNYNRETENTRKKSASPTLNIAALQIQQEVTEETEARVCVRSPFSPLPPVQESRRHSLTPNSS